MATACATSCGWPTRPIGIEASSATVCGAPGAGDAVNATAELAWALILGLFNDWLRDPRLFDPDTDAEHLLEPMFRGLVRDWGQASSAP